eukprot:CAMPEP_0173335084 /NCGR_PEP_ID=MMETSP1144-20121109/5782_1 /TAXON_ID=483371 /ORGANISM="non described non described, Strain CCMP2298" /LENGTH=230 /DNA_ID=CAMNT_0014280181 /DNA_START=169 /DNA_END=861 /DNA_ORIENTATION=+
MFNPSNVVSKSDKVAKKKALADLKTLCESMIPTELHEGMIVDVKEVVCGDPSCAPIDTVFTFLWQSGGKGVFAIPLTAVEISRDELVDFFPDEDILHTWRRGEKARWPRLPELRYNVQDRVECRIGPHPVKGWAPGRIIKLHYSEPNWPPNMVAPYQIALHDGRLIFAPQDTDQVIRLRPPAAPDAPSPAPLLLSLPAPLLLFLSPCPTTPFPYSCPQPTVLVPPPSPCP